MVDLFRVLLAAIAFILAAGVTFALLSLILSLRISTEFLSVGSVLISNRSSFACSLKTTDFSFNTNLCSGKVFLLIFPVKVGAWGIASKSA